MALDEMAWKYNHCQYSFLPHYQLVEHDFESFGSSDIVINPQSPGLIQNVESKGNFRNITKTILVDISVKPGVVENLHMGQSCSASELGSYMVLFKEFSDIFALTYEEIPGIDPSIVVHDIRSYPDAKLVRKKLHQVHPQKETTIKEEIEKLLKARFVYPVPLIN